MYRTKRFRAVALDEIERDLADVCRRGGDKARRVFLADGDAMCLSSARLIEILDRVNQAIPRLHRVGIYANARDIERKSDEELLALRQRKLRMVYLGLESGDDETLAKVHKGATSDEMVRAVRRVQSAGISASVMVLIGLAGRARSQEHAARSAEVVNRMQPAFTALLTYTPTPASPLFEALDRGDFELPSPVESLAEIRRFVEGIDCKTYFACNHASNYLPLKGTFPEAKTPILQALDAALQGEIALKPEFLRGL